MHAGHVACCPWWVTVSMPTGQTDKTDRRTDARPLYYIGRYVNRTLVSCILYADYIILWNLEHSEYIVGGWSWQILGTIRAVATAWEPAEIFLFFFIR